MAGKLYLIPTLLGESDWRLVLPASIPDVLRDCRHFIVENVRSARRFLRLLHSDFPIDDCQFFLIDKHTKAIEKRAYLDALKVHEKMCLLSEAGCPGIADPGSDIVRMAHEKNIQVVPLTGPSSIVLSLMASGLNGQLFKFHGYLPIEKAARQQIIRDIEKQSRIDHSAHIFIETPYRNNALVQDLIQVASGDLHLCVARNLTLETEYIKTKTLNEWKKAVPELHKETCIFIVGF